MKVQPKKKRKMIKWLVGHYYNLLSGLLMGAVGYFAPVNNIVAVVAVAVAVDFLSGIWASYVQGKGIKSKRMTKTIYKIALYICIVYLFFAIDKEMQMIELHRFVAWVIVGFEMYSILENATKITNHRIFRVLRKLMEDKLEEQGVKIDEKESKQ